MLLVPGWSDSARVMRHLRASLVDAGFSEDNVVALSFADSIGSNIDHAVEIGVALRNFANASTGARRIAVVAHSMGGLALRWHLATTPDSTVALAVYVAAPHRGTPLAYLAPGRGGREMRPGSRFLKNLEQSERTAIRRDKQVCFRAPFDTRVLPPASAWLPGAERLTFAVGGHRRVLRHPDGIRAIRDLLLEYR